MCESLDLWGWEALILEALYLMYATKEVPPRPYDVRLRTQPSRERHLKPCGSFPVHNCRRSGRRPNRDEIDVPSHTHNAPLECRLAA
ncbi:MAG: hypothetical protein LZF60_260009 [Nitrospira sp.]|nr:MAG: hypothetical protein LZF60_260009 [Nitrospira sp.]